MSEIQDLITKLNNIPLEKDDIAKTLLAFSSSVSESGAKELASLETNPDFENLPKNIQSEVTIFLNTLSSDRDATFLINDDSTRVSTTKVEGYNEAEVTKIQRNQAISASPNTEQDGSIFEQSLVIKNRFVLVEKLGFGGMGTVYKARDIRKEEAEDVNPYLALKVLNNDFKGHPDAFKGLQRETKKAQALAHPNIVNVYDFDRDGDLIYMTMELLEGETLKQIIRNNPSGLTLADAIPIINDLCQALAYAHKNKIIHADFKPGNVFVLAHNNAKILDFGIAQAASNSTEKDLVTDTFSAADFGAYTPPYATAEMVEGKPLESTDDVYALACVVYELIGGEHPYKRLSAVDAAAQGLKPKPLSKLKRKQWLTLQNALSPYKSKRLQTVNEFIEGFLLPNRIRNRVLLTVGLLLAIITSSVSVYLKPDVIEFAPSIVDLTQDQRKQIDSLLETAKLYISIGQLASPPGDSALDVYDRILEIDASNRDAISGKVFIADEYESLAKAALETGNNSLAKAYINTGLLSLPTHEGLKSLRNQEGIE